jgi:hypothetical protein
MKLSGKKPSVWIQLDRRLTVQRRQIDDGE